MQHTSIIWFRNDLRLHDNEALTEAIAKSEFIIPVYVFDERVFRGKTKFGFEKCGKFRTKFIIESVEDLRQNLRKLGSELIIRVGLPEIEIFKLAKENKTSWVFCNRERTSEEVKVQDALENKLWTIGQELRYVRGKMLYHTADLPFPVCQVPDTFTNYRKEIENIISVRSPFPVPKYLPGLPQPIDSGVLPDLESYDKDTDEIVHPDAAKFKGGETAALAQLDYYLWESNQITHYKNTRNQLLGWDFSSKLSPWLAAGCISPKYVYQQLKLYEDKIEKNESTYWLYFELLWRDFFRLMGKKYGNKIFKPSGIKGIKPLENNNEQTFYKWSSANTGVPFVDANMIQLNNTGYMSNRGRQIVASFLVHDLKVNWLMGAEYFESQLIDYDPCSNYGNWLYIAGVGNDPREDRHFNVQSQEKKYDPDRKFQEYWLQQHAAEIMILS
ncbi:MAG: DASH family cryptochrome [Saprospiraceae bacterium]|jgi:deoxyribodipyrimidine photo-lyase|nr:DASH family cryptochrome [Saprospiraceae bacterium]